MSVPEPDGFNPRRDYCLFATCLRYQPDRHDRLFQSQTGLLPLCDGMGAMIIDWNVDVSIPDGIIASLRLHLGNLCETARLGFNPRRDYCLFATLIMAWAVLLEERFQSQTGLLPLCDVTA